MSNQVLHFCALAALLVGCTSMPKGFTQGPKDLHPRWGWRVSAKNATGLDLEIAVLWYAMVCTGAEEQIDPSRAIFLSWASAVAKEHGHELEPLSAVELVTSHVRSDFDGTCTVRVGKRLRWVMPARTPSPW